MCKQKVYSFGAGMRESKAATNDLLGGKGANLAKMAALGLPIPPGFTIPTTVCAYVLAHEALPDGLMDDVRIAIKQLETATGKRFGCAHNPLFVSVRSGAPTSMPGMMDTILNLGLNDQTLPGLADQMHNPRTAWDCYRRFASAYATLAMGVDGDILDQMVDSHICAEGLIADSQITPQDWQSMMARFMDTVAQKAGRPFPQDPYTQLEGAIKAVFRSWHAPRAITYRAIQNLPDTPGTAVTVQTMVFGNAGPGSATGVAFSRNPSTGDNTLYGEYLLGAQGEDIVAGIRTPRPLTIDETERDGGFLPALEEVMPDAFSDLEDHAKMLETHFRDAQDIEFTIERCQLYILQTRSAKRAVQAALKIAVDMVAEGLITKQEAILRIDAVGAGRLLLPVLDPEAAKTVLARGLPAAPGVASGILAFSSQKAIEMAAAGHKVILARPETAPTDIAGMHAAQGVLTARGGMTSHAATVARSMGRPCVAGAALLEIDEAKAIMHIGSKRFDEGQMVTINGNKGELLLGLVPFLCPAPSPALAKILEWATALCHCTGEPACRIARAQAILRGTPSDDLPCMD